MTSAEKLSTGPSRTCARGLDVDGNINIPGNSLRPRAHACTWREACKAADYVLEHFGNPLRDRGIWVWLCQRLGLNQFLDLADEVISSARQGEVKSPQTTQTHCRRQPKTSLRPPCAPSVANQFCLATKGAQRSTKVFRVGAPPQTPDSLPKAYPLAEGNREATATVVPKTSLRLPCALSVANQLCLATKGAQRGTKVFRVGAPPQTPDHDAGKRGAK